MKVKKDIKVNKLCITCANTCKQNDFVVVVKCPLFKAK